jgi:acetaldehyde dehydrogenase / alcohol dehydrogenase
MADAVQQIDQLVAKAKKAAENSKPTPRSRLTRSWRQWILSVLPMSRSSPKWPLKKPASVRADHKAIKNHLGAHIVYEWQKDKKSVGVIEEKDGVTYIAEPFGVIAAATPTTNPTSTTEFKSIIALKGRNVVIFAFHPKAQKCSAYAAS